MAGLITPVVTSSKSIYAHEISISITGLSSNSLPNVRGQYLSQPLVDWNGKHFSMQIYRLGIDKGSRGRFSFSFHVVTPDYTVPLAVSFLVNLQGSLISVDLFNVSSEEQISRIISKIGRAHV